VWSGANVSGIPIHDFCEIRGHYDHEQAMEQIYRRVRESAYQIIEEKGATYYGVAMAVTRIVVALIRDEGAVLPISSLMQGEYGLSDLCISVPAIVGGNGVQQVLEIPLNEKEHTELLHSANELKEILQKIWL
jgi:L-lactate dehydrogenase